MPRKALTPEQKEKYETVKLFIRALEKECRRKIGERITYKLVKVIHGKGLYAYTESDSKESLGRIEIRFVKGKPKIVSSFMFPHIVKRALKDLTFVERIKMTISENKWKGIKS